MTQLATSGYDARVWEIPTSIVARANTSEITADAALNSAPLCTIQQQQPPASNNAQKVKINAVTWSADNSLLITCSSSGVMSARHMVVNNTLHSKSATNTQRMQAAAMNCAAAGGSRQLVTGSATGQLLMWDLRTGIITGDHSSAHGGAALRSVAFSADASLLASADANGTLCIHNTVSNVLKTGIRTGSALSSVAWSPAKKQQLAAAMDGGAVTVYDTVTEQVLYSNAKAHSVSCTSLKYMSTSSGLLASVGLDKILLLSDVSARQSAGKIVSDYGLQCVDAAPDSHIVAAGTVNGHVLLYDTRHTSRPVARIMAAHPSTPVLALAWQNASKQSDRPQIATIRSTSSGGVTTSTKIAPKLGSNAPITDSSAVLGNLTNAPSLSRPMSSDSNAPVVPRQPNSEVQQRPTQPTANAADMDIFSPVGANKVTGRAASALKPGVVSNRSVTTPLTAAEAAAAHMRNMSMTGTVISPPRSPSVQSRSSSSNPTTNVPASNTATSDVLTTYGNATKVAWPSATEQPTSSAPFDQKQQPAQNGSSAAAATSSAVLSNATSQSKHSQSHHYIVTSQPQSSLQHQATAFASMSGKANQHQQASVEQRPQLALPPTESETMSSAPRSTSSESAVSAQELAVLKAALADSVQQAQAVLQNDVANLHIDLLRQFHLHEQHTERALSGFLSEFKSVVAELQQARAENDAYRKAFG